MKFVFAKDAVKNIEKMDHKRRFNIKEAIEGIPEGDIKPMQGTPTGRYRLRVGGYRVIFRYDDAETVHILAIGSRGDIYK